ncbi:DUF1064 domain-containing protein (plasmid) [Burkholderia vietnamiensis]|uniref:DUF1064 domain-containing protein n=1 Tax=Burkholderia vietnamiensis (strain G4 / LMG 22486) TaxID=269482 RepID=A4JWC1_BURVG|nr:protein of unknown function DUF1064 [Burkholderia vietnamiensis G4]MCB4349747.1 DUF1064 domain-containing protein [Burkholderia vietnamiensis]
MAKGGKKKGSKGVVRWSAAQLAAYLANRPGATSTTVAGGAVAPAEPADDVPARRGKYNAKPTYVGTIKFDSKREAARYQELRRMELAGLIRDLRLQVVFVLAPAVDIGEARKKPALRYIADFAYVEGATGEQVVEDAKGFRTRSYRDKKHLMKSVHNIIIREV